MGCYVNPKGMSKEEWLTENGFPVSEGQARNTMKNEAYRKEAGILPVILIDNGLFTAAGVAYCKEEFEAFTDPSDTREKLFFLCTIEDLREVCPLDNYYKE